MCERGVVLYIVRRLFPSPRIPLASDVLLSIPPLASSMMAPGLPDVAQKYGITDPTIVALTLVVFLISFALAVSIPSLVYLRFTRISVAFGASSPVRNVWQDMGLPYRKHLHSCLFFGMRIFSKYWLVDCLSLPMYILYLLHPSLNSHYCSGILRSCSNFARRCNCGRCIC